MLYWAHYRMSDGRYATIELMIGKIVIEFITWFHEFSVNTNILIFQGTEFVYLFLCTVNINNNINFL